MTLHMQYAVLNLLTCGKYVQSAVCVRYCLYKLYVVADGTHLLKAYSVLLVGYVVCLISVVATKRTPGSWVLCMFQHVK